MTERACAIAGAEDSRSQDMDRDAFFFFFFLRRAPRSSPSGRLAILARWD